MADDRADVITKAAQRAVALAFKMAERLANDIGQPGTERQTAREVRGLVRAALDGQEVAYDLVMQLHGQQRVLPGGKNPVEEDIAAVLKERGAG